MKKVAIERKTSGTKTKCPSLEVLAAEYSQMTARAIARKYSVSEATVRSWIYRARKREESEV